MPFSVLCLQIHIDMIIEFTWNREIGQRHFYFDLWSKNVGDKWVENMNFECLSVWLEANYSIQIVQATQVRWLWFFTLPLLSEWVIFAFMEQVCSKRCRKRRDWRENSRTRRETERGDDKGSRPLNKCVGMKLFQLASNLNIRCWAQWKLHIWWTPSQVMCVEW